jgi:uncharacterized protein
MKLDFDRGLDLPVSADRAWNFLEHIDKVASCLPGAAITDEIDPTHYRGAVSVRLGPVNMSFQGTIEILNSDPAKRTISLAGKGTDKGGSSVAEMELTATVTETGPQSSNVAGKASVGVNGKAAALGARLMNSAADQIIKEFYANLLKNVQAEPAPQIETAASVANAAAPPARSLNGFAFFWAVLKSFFAGLLSGKKAPS